jgi:hypothetical protein
MAELLTPGTALLAEREYVLARRALLEIEPVSPRQLELVGRVWAAVSRWHVSAGAVGPYHAVRAGARHRRQYQDMSIETIAAWSHPYLMADQDTQRSTARWPRSAS